MGSLRQDLLAAARAAVSEDLLLRPPLADEPAAFGVVLGGSAVTDDADVYSGCDLFAFRLGRGASGAGEWRWHWVRDGRHVYRYAVLGLVGFRQAVSQGQDDALYLLWHGQILHDPGGRLAAAWTQARAEADSLWPTKLAYRYRSFRQRRASLAWGLRRGQPLQVLDNLRLLLEHALSCCYHLQAEPAPPRKWLFRGGLRTRAGRTLRAPVLDLLSSLGDLATLGGSFNLNQNRLYLQAGRLQRTLEEALAAAGHPVPALAAQAMGAAPEANWGGDDAQGRTPRRRPDRPARRRGAGRHAR